MAKLIFWKNSWISNSLVSKNSCVLILLILFLLIVFSIYFLPNFLEPFELQEEVTFYVITLHTEERLKNIETQQAKMKTKINYFDGVNGREVDINSVKDPKIDKAFKTNEKIRNNEIGCYLSHYYLYQKIASSGNPKGYTVIFEDDFVIDDDFETKLAEGLERVGNKDFDILYLENQTNNIGKVTEHPQICEMDRNIELFGTLAYLVKNKNIPKIIQNTNFMKVPIDVQLRDSIFGGALKAYTFCPFIVKQSGMPSTIR